MLQRDALAIAMLMHIDIHALRVGAGANFNALCVRGAPSPRGNAVTGGFPMISRRISSGIVRALDFTIRNS